MVCQFAKTTYNKSRGMSKPPKKAVRSSSFYMKGGAKTEYKSTILIDFSPLQAQGFVRQQMKQLGRERSIIPTYNNDQLIFTPTFRLPSLQIDHAHYQQKFAQKREQYQQIDIDEIMVPRPRNKDYCNVCERKFNDYYEHSYSQHHLQQLANNKFQRRIIRLCQRYHERHMRRERERTKSFSDSHHQEGFKPQAQPIGVLNE